MSLECHTKVSDCQREAHQKLTLAFGEHKRREDELTQSLERLRAEKDLSIRGISLDKERARAEFEAHINEVELLAKRQEHNIVELRSQTLELRTHLVQKQDVEAQLSGERDRNEQMDQQKQQLQREQETASDYIIELEDKVYKANKTSLELLKHLKDAEGENETLKNYIIELKQRIAVYIPVKDDPIDKRLAEFINNYPERQRLKIMFMRESEGVYQFGTKRIAVRVEKDKINIRVGGGYLSIDEFLDQYTPTELERLERKDPLKKFSEKIAVHKTIVGKEIREASPLRASPVRPGNVSPGRGNISPGKRI
jgi:chromosome segregation ATPase